LDLTTDGMTLCTGSSDSKIKFWSLIFESNIRSRTFLSHKRTLQLHDEILCLKISSNSEFIACSLLDQTIRIFYFNTLKFYLSLYGHHLPVLSIDISTDGQLLISGSADKNIKIWGLNFGDLHKVFLTN